MAKRLKRQFFIDDTLKIAKKLLGKNIVVVYKNKKLIGKIVETEAYIGPIDKASHAYKNKRTKRNYIEYEQGGRIYIYLVYGLYYQLNLTTNTKGKPECVLIRALEPIKNITAETNGPGKLCKALHLNKSFYGEDVTKSKRIWLEDNKDIKSSLIGHSPRIGINYAGPYWSKRYWRFFIKNNKFVSK
ncbi:MAG: DNA-3-methyladenine glycosylase [Minisyncoccia bacterium]